jgi:hypothetical protein
MSNPYILVTLRVAGEPEAEYLVPLDVAERAAAMLREASHFPVEYPKYIDLIAPDGSRGVVVHSGAEEAEYLMSQVPVLGLIDALTVGTDPDTAADDHLADPEPEFPEIHADPEPTPAPGPAEVEHEEHEPQED